MNHEAFGLSGNLFAFLDWHEFFFLLFIIYQAINLVQNYFMILQLNLIIKGTR